MWDELLCDASTWFTASCGPKQEAKGLCPWGQVLREACLSPSQVVIPVVSVQMIKKHKMARLLPNGLAITTNTSQKVSEFLGLRSLVHLCSSPGVHSLTLALSQVFTHFTLFCFLSMFQYVFVSLLSRDSVYDMLRRVCTHLQVWSLGAAVGLERLLRPGLRSWELLREVGLSLQHREWVQGKSNSSGNPSTLVSLSL